VDPEEEEEFEILGGCALAALARSDPDELVECPDPLARKEEEEEEEEKVEYGAFGPPPQK
jgi:sugar (pentulose or hexulose) kinase